LPYKSTVYCLKNPGHGHVTLNQVPAYTDWQRADCHSTTECQLIQFSITYIRTFPPFFSEFQQLSLTVTINNSTFSSGISDTSDHGRGLMNHRYHSRCIQYLSRSIDKTARQPQCTHTVAINRELGIVNQTKEHSEIFRCKARRQQHRQTMSLHSESVHLDGQQQRVGDRVDYEQLKNSLLVIRELMLQRVVVFLSHTFTHTPELFPQN